MSDAVLVTGGTGFIGAGLLQRLTGNRRIVASARGAGARPPGPDWVESGDLADAGWHGVFPKVDAVVHLAAIAHEPAGSSAEVRRRILAVNGQAPIALARQAAAAGVRRFVFLSSIKALAESSTRPLRPDDPPAPVDVYGEAKRFAEDGLRQLQQAGTIEVVIVRCPLVYGPGVRGNFRALLRLTQSGWPLPFGAVQNRRSLVSLWNLVDCLAHALDAPWAAGRTLHVTDGASVSTAELVRLVARAGGRHARLVSVPLPLLRVVLMAAGGRSAAVRLLGSLELDDSATRAGLPWRPVLSLEEGLARTVRARP
jgi:nucleoside-diphosphate-sugar epimerase